MAVRAKTVAADLLKLTRHFRDLPGFLRRHIDREDAVRLLREALAEREAHFLHIVEHAVFARPESPYRGLMRWAGIDHATLRQLLASRGLEATLQSLYDAGVSVTADEFKGRRPIVRPGLELATTASAFDNPLLTAHYEAATSGSTGPRTRSKIDLELLEHEAAYVVLYLDAFELWRRPYGTWRPLPPALAAVKWMLRLERAGKPLDRWYSHDRSTLRGEGWKFALFTRSTLAIGRLCGHRLPSPRYAPTNNPSTVLRWLEQCRDAGEAAVLDTMVSSAVRLCIAARESEIDISGTLFRVGGEPLTAAKVCAIEAAGCRVVTFYSGTETSFVGAPCSDSDRVDDVHLLTDKFAALARPVRLGSERAQELVLTSLLPATPKIMLNVESGDFAVMEERACDCPLGRLGFRHHLHGIASHAKLTGEGVTFFAPELFRLVDEVLPRQFGGDPTDWQLVETEDRALTRVLVVAHPRIGPLEEREVQRTVLAALASCPGGETMTRAWREAGTLRLVRREPLRTDSAKILPLHVQRRQSGLSPAASVGAGADPSAISRTE